MIHVRFRRLRRNRTSKCRLAPRNRTFNCRLLQHRKNDRPPRKIKKKVRQSFTLKLQLNESEKKPSFFVFFLFLARNKHEDGRHERRKPEKHERPKNSGTSSEKSPTKSKSRKNETLLQHHEFQFFTDFRYRTKTSSDVAVAPIQFSRSFHRFEQKRESGPQIRKWTFEDKR